MAITFSEKKKIQHLLIPVLGVVIFITAAVIWWGFFTSSTSVPEGASAVQRRVKIDASILSHPLLELLDEPGEKTKIPLEIGRENPLLPSLQ